MTHVATATGEATAPYLCGGEVCPESGVGHLLLPTGRDIFCPGRLLRVGLVQAYMH